MRVQARGPRAMPATPPDGGAFEKEVIDCLSIARKAGGDQDRSGGPRDGGGGEASGLMATAGGASSGTSARPLSSADWTIGWYGVRAGTDRVP